MRSFKAILAGSLFIIVVGLVIELAYIFLAVGYNSLARNYPWLSEISIYFRYVIGIPVLFLIMFIGGYITADVAKQKVLLHCLVVAMITNGVMLASALENRELTLSGLVVAVLALASTLAGGWYWQRGVVRQG